MKNTKRPETAEKPEAPEEWEPYAGKDGKTHQEDPETW